MLVCRLACCCCCCLQHVVFVWDFDETLVPLHSLITGRYAAVTGGGVDAAKAAALGRQLQGLVVQLSDSHLHFKEVRRLT